MTSEAQIGLRVFLNDAASQGIRGLVGNIGILDAGLRGLAYSAVHAGLGFNSQERSLSQVQAAIRAGEAGMLRYQDSLAGMTYKSGLLADELQKLRDKSAALTAEMNALRAAGASQFLRPSQIAAAELEVEQLEKKLNSLQLEQKMVPQGTAKWRELDAEIDLVSKRLEIARMRLQELNDASTAKLQTEMDRLAAKNDTLIAQEDKLIERQRLYNEQITATQAKMAEMQAQMAADSEEAQLLQQRQELVSSSMKQMMIGGGIMLAFGAAIGWTVKQAADLETALVLVKQRVAGANENIAAMTTLITHLSNTSIYSNQQIAEGFAELGAKGKTAAEFLQTSLGPALVHLSEAMGQTGLKGTADVLGAALDAWRAPASAATHYADVLDVAFKNGIPDVEQLAMALRQVGPQAATMGISIDQLVPVLDVLARAFNSGSVAGTDLKNLLINITNPTNKAIGALTDLGIVTAHDTAPALRQLERALDDSGSAGSKAVAGFDGSVEGIHKLWDAAKKANIPGLGNDWYEWAIKVGAVSNAFYDAQGNFAGLLNYLQKLHDATKHLSAEETDRYLAQLAGSKTGLKALENLLGQWDKVKPALDDITAKLRQQGQAAADAATKEDTLAARWQEFHTNIQNLAAAIGGPLLGNLKELLVPLSGMVGNLTLLFQQNPQLTIFVDGLLKAGLAVGGIILLAGAIRLLGAAFALMGAAGPLGAILVILGMILVALPPVQQAFADFFGAIKEQQAQSVLDQQIADREREQSYIDSLTKQRQQLDDFIAHTHNDKARLQAELDRQILDKQIADEKQKLENIKVNIQENVQQNPDNQNTPGLPFDPQAVADQSGRPFKYRGKTYWPRTKDSSSGGGGSGQGDQSWWPAVGDFLSGLGSGLAQVATDFWNHLLNPGDVIGQKATALGQKFGQLFLEGINPTSPADLLGRLLGKIDWGNAFGNFINSSVVTQAVATALNNAVTGATKLFAGQFNIADVIGKAMPKPDWGKLGQTLMTGLADGIRANLGFIGTAAQGIWQTIVTNIQSWFGPAHDKGGEVTKHISGGITDWVPNVIPQAVNTLWGVLTNSITSLMSGAYTWGQNIIQGIINGINSMLGALQGAAGAAAAVVAQFLPHSPAERGPLKDLDKSGPGLVNTLAQGIVQSVGQLEAAMALAMNVAARKIGLPAPWHWGGTGWPVAGLPAQAQAQAAPIQLHLTIDSREVAEAVFDSHGNILRLHGLGRILK